MYRAIYGYFICAIRSKIASLNIIADPSLQPRARPNKWVPDYGAGLAGPNKLGKGRKMRPSPRGASERSEGSHCERPAGGPGPLAEFE